jgi:predicted PurR-regulated permease PerM
VAKVGRALLNWWRAAVIDAVAVGVLWLLGLWLLHISLAPLWALIAALAQFIPNFGGMLALIGPSLSLLFTGGGWQQFGLLLGLYAAIVLIDQLGIQPFLMKKNTRVPIWASIFGPIVLGILIPFWGVLLAPPLLAVAFAFRRPKAPVRSR